MTERAKHLKLAIDVGSDPITGFLAVGAGAPTRFCGWIELASAIEAVRYDGDLALDEVPEAGSAEPALG